MDKERLEVSAFGVDFKATGSIARRALPFLTFLVLATGAFYLVSSRIVNRLDKVSSDQVVMKADIADIKTYLKLRPSPLAAAKKPTIVASR